MSISTRLASKLLPLAIVVAVLAAACAHDSGGSTATGPSAAVVGPAVVANGTWNLQSLTRPDSTVVTITEAGQFTLALGEDGSVALRVDCNRGAGSYTLAGSTLTVGPLATTKAYCPSAPLDDEYLQLIGGTTTISATATSLQMTSPRGTLRFGR